MLSRMVQCKRPFFCVRVICVLCKLGEEYPGNKGSMLNIYTYISLCQMYNQIFECSKRCTENYLIRPR